MERQLTWTAAVLAGAIGALALAWSSTTLGWIACAFVFAMLLLMQY